MLNTYTIDFALTAAKHTHTQNDNNREEEHIILIKK